MQSHGDGLQILRYNISKAYNSHLDWIEDKVRRKKPGMSSSVQHFWSIAAKELLFGTSTSAPLFL
jgi:hypothetical protein